MQTVAYRYHKLNGFIRFEYGYNMPAPTSPYKERFRREYPEIHRGHGNRFAIGALRGIWVGQAQSKKSIKLIPDARTMREWRKQLFPSSARGEWADPAWDGSAPDHVPIGWMWSVNLFAEAVLGIGMTQRQATHAIRLFSSVETLEVSGVWVLIHEYVAQDYNKHVFGEHGYSAIALDELDAIVALKAWTCAGRKTYLELASPDPNRSEDPEIGIIPTRIYPASRHFGPPTFLEHRLRASDKLERNFYSLLIIHFSHLIGNPFDKSHLTSKYFAPELVERFKTDTFEGMSWQDILVWEHIG